jgi:hypothetical protein
MSRRRFSQVLRGARGAAAKQRYLDKLEGLGQGENIGTKGPRPASIKIYLEPFQINFPSALLMEFSALQPSWNALKGYAGVASRAKDVLSGTDLAIPNGKAKAARIVRRTKDATGAVTTSKLTGLKYLKYNTTSISAPIGQKNDTDSFAAAKSEITNQIGTGYSISFIDEDF